MKEQDFCLKWDGHQSNVTHLLNSLRQSDELVDVTLCCNSERIAAHRIVLSVCSPYFRELLKEYDGKHVVFCMPEVGGGELRALVDFMYCGRVTVAERRLASFLRMAELLQISGLSGSALNCSSGSSCRPVSKQHRSQPCMSMMMAAGDAPHCAPTQQVLGDSSTLSQSQSFDVAAPPVVVVNETDAGTEAPACVSSVSACERDPPPPLTGSDGKRVRHCSPVTEQSPPLHHALDDSVSAEAGGVEATRDSVSVLSPAHHYHEKQAVVNDTASVKMEMSVESSAATDSYLLVDEDAGATAAGDNCDAAESPVLDECGATLGRVIAYENVSVTAANTGLAALDCAVSHCTPPDFNTQHAALQSSDSSIVSMDYSVAQVVGGVGSHVCVVCRRCYTSRIALNDHMKRHQGLTRCCVCRRALATVSALRVHLQKQHGWSRELILMHVPRVSR